MARPAPVTWWIKVFLAGSSGDHSLNEVWSRNSDPCWSDGVRGIERIR